MFEFSEIRPAALIQGKASHGKSKSAYNSVFKRIFDVFFCLLIAPLVLPVVAVLAFIVRMDGGPAFFSHTRVGRDGRAFKCWKIRSMVVGAEEKLKAHLENNPEAAAEWERDFKLTDDPRITRLGDIMRRTSLDELPQFFNVFRGDMSVVGPRPITEIELMRYGTHQRAYLDARPGVTGVWQVSGRNDVSYESRVEMDASYMEKMSLGLDISIIFKTITHMLLRTGR